MMGLTRYPETARLVCDARSFIELRRLENPPARLRASREPVRVRFRGLHGAPVRLRPQSEDDGLAHDVFVGRYHLPPEELRLEDIRMIWDLGANIGLTMAHLASLCPNAHIVGVELDAANAELCRENTGAWRDRCEVIRAAVWVAEGLVEYTRPTGREQSFHVVARGAADAEPPGGASAPAISLNRLLERTGADAIDYVKMDIEGAERAVLGEHTEWAAHVRAIKVELHHRYEIDECLEDLRRLGFVARPIMEEPRWGALGVRP
jgi:FkbM family methyltransferase